MTMMRCIKHFFQGIVMQHVDYSTRHFSRCYEIGATTGGVALIAVPVMAIFALGFVFGRLT